MSEWWTYRPSDFLMFAPETYWRQFELHNAALWPWLLLPAALLLALLAMLLNSPIRRSELALRGGLATLAVCWGFVAWSFLWDRYAPINWAAKWFAFGFLMQALGLLGMTYLHGLRVCHQPTRRTCALVLLVWATLIHPFLALALDRPLTQAEPLGTTPDPTALATLGWLLWADARSRTGRWWLWASQGATLMWCAVSAATLWTMGSAQALVMLGAALVAAGALWRWPYGKVSESPGHASRGHTRADP